ncbi:MAG: NAD kinase [Microscillaceae bacterium]|nr:NAD kinase [Microscillaceae bacterium]
MKIAIHGRTFKNEFRHFIMEMFEELTERGAEIQVSDAFYDFVQQSGIKHNIISVYSHKKDIFDANFLFSLGGDGTLLESVTHVGEKQIPILGVNMGRLGFLATTSPADIRATIRNIYQGYYKVEERVLVSVDSDWDIFDGINFGLNEFTITKRDTSSMIVVHTYIDGEYLNSYWADGLIVATPTGSTGYSLSCGGPVVLPQSNNFIIAPVSPHNLNVRPLVVSDDSVISFGIEGRSKNFLVSLDSRSKVIDATAQIAIRKEKFKARLVKMYEDNFLNTLRKKLNWGLDIRNY